MKTYETLIYTEDNRIGVLKLNRPKALNALNAQLIAEIYDFVVNELPPLKLYGLIITGEGEKAFVAGADISEFKGANSSVFNKKVKEGQDIMNAIERSKTPIIAAVNGFALGGGAELAMACHMRVASENARFGTPEVNLGLLPGYGGTQRLVQLVGKTKAYEILMTGEMIDANTAERLGLVNYTVPAGTEIEKAKEIIGKIATKAPIAISKIIECVNDYFDETKDGYKTEKESFAALADTKDFTEGVNAFLEKRKPIFKGE